jgi:hypothetical protein
MAERLTVLLKHSVGGSEAQNSRESASGLASTAFASSVADCAVSAERICHIKFSKDMQCAGETIASRDLP